MPALSLTAAQIQSLAPDASSAAAGRKLAKPGSWTNLGRTSDALWGECQGSALYQTRVALVDLASQCSCPSRKFPCKHALGLMFLAVDSQAVGEAEPPEWVTSWLAKRGAAAEKKKARSEEAASKPVDTAAQARRAEKRRESILAGLDQLDAWMSDLVRQGLSRAQSESLSFWDAQARRLVDAQAPGLSSRLRQLGSRTGERSEWASRLLDDLGILSLVTHAYRRMDQLDPLLQADLQRSVGITLDQAEVVAHGDVVDDTWLVLADAVEDEERVRVQRAWLRGEKSKRMALVLQFAAAGARFSEALPSGARLSAKLAFWPSAMPQRALVVERRGTTEAVAAAPAGDTVTAELGRFADELGRLPWLERTMFVLEGIVPASGEAFNVVDREGHALPLVGREHDLLLAISGGHPVTLAGEWDGYALTPRTVWAEGRMTTLGGRRE